MKSTIQIIVDDIKVGEPTTFVKQGPLIDELGKKWYKDNLLHREDGPAIERHNGSKHWYINNERHRLDGPAIEYANGSKYWYYHDKWIREISSQEEFEQWLKYRSFL